MTRLALIFAIVFLMVMQAHAQERHHWGPGDSGRHGGWHRPWPGPVYRHDDNAAVGGFLGGLLGGYLWGRQNEPVRDEAWCVQRYRSYDPYTKTYLGFDGLRHGCP